MRELERYKTAVSDVVDHLRAYGLDLAYLTQEVEGIINGALNPPPAYEDVEVMQWAVVAPSGFVETTYASEEIANKDVSEGGDYPGYRVAKLTGTIKRPLPTPVEKMTHGIAADGSVVLDIGDQPKPGTPCVVMWEENHGAHTKAVARRLPVTLCTDGTFQCRALMPNIKQGDIGWVGEFIYISQEDQ